MKKIKFLATLLAAGALVACNETIEPQGSGENTPTTGEGYVKVAINMPTTSGDMTKADPSFDDGLGSEYAVKSAALVFFKAAQGVAESSAEFVKAYDVTLSLAGEGGSDNQVTNRHIVLNEAPIAGNGEQIYALAILNYESLFSVNDDKLLKSGADVFGTEKTIKALQTATTVGVEELSDGTANHNGFLMTNSPLSTVPKKEDLTDLTRVQTLVPVTVYAEKATAESSPAANIYVERAVAKVTLKGFKYTDDDGYTAPVAESDTESPFTGDMVKLSGWTLNVTNKTTNVVRDINDITTWCGSNYCTDNRFLGQTMIDGNDLYRIYWGKDHNYSNEYTDAKNEFNIYTEDAKIKWNQNAEHDNSSYPLYCLENTMDYNFQNENQTTTLLLKTTYIADPSSSNQNFFMVGTTALTYSEERFLQLVKTTLSLEEGAVVELSSNAEGGVYTLNGIKKIKELLTVGGTAISDNQAQALYNNFGEIRFYKEGAAYYNTVLIRHFSDDYTDVVWDASNPTYGPKHLGRYGVLRNNWYEINITSISGPGDPEIIDPGTDPNDDEKGYIRAQINVLSWAKRSQDVDL